jgi:RimJ/RimL family protein N-acetyltransferase
VRIDGNGWYLRPDRADDAPDVARAFAEDPQLAVDWGIDETLDENLARRWWAEHEREWERDAGRHFAIVEAGSDDFLGGLNFHHINLDHARAEVGFWLAPWARGRGIGGGAVYAACAWAFDRWGLKRIEMTTAPDNAASLALARKLGFTREGVLRSRNRERGEHVDVVMLGVLAGELRQP